MEAIHIYSFISTKSLLLERLLEVTRKIGKE